jgi:uncharacterized protein (DUF1684 family)
MTSPEKWQNWLASRNRFFSDPAGFLSITTIGWLTEEPQSIVGVSGLWSANGNTISVKNSNSGDFSWSIADDTQIDFDGIKLELAIRNNQMVIRPRDPKSEMLKTFESVITFDYDPRFTVTAKLLPFEAPKEIVVGSVVEGMSIGYVSPGVLEFEFEGETYRLTAFDKPGSKDLVIIYKDATSGSISYGTGRSVSASYQDDGSYLIDFNFSGNFPCSYTDFATCPVAPIENRLPFAVEAGEKKPIYRNTANGVLSQVSQ